jgi:hypothetical protein
MPEQIVVQCLRCRHVGRVAESDLTRRGIKPNAPIASFVKRLRCLKCGSHSVAPNGRPSHAAKLASRKSEPPVVCTSDSRKDICLWNQKIARSVRVGQDS